MLLLKNEKGGIKIKGKVKWFNPKKGWGFIEGEDGRDFFAYFKDIQMEGYKALSQNEEVTFEVAETEKGKKAVEIKKILDK